MIGRPTRSTPERVTTEWKRLLDFAASGARRPFALATLVGRQGSSYRLPGARLLIDAEGRHAGCLSGGCLEEGIAQVGLRVLRTGAGERLHLDTRPHFGCPGQLDIFIEPLADAVLGEIGRALAARERVWLSTRFGVSQDGESPGTRVGRERSDAETETTWIEELGLQPRLVVASATSDADALCELAVWMGWDVRRVVHSAEARGEVAVPAGARVELVAPEKLAETIPPDERTACVIMTHHLGRDLAYLRNALAAAYPYVGLLGSRRRRETLLGELGDSGLLEDASVAERLRAPVGLDLGAEEPRGIALAIVAEIQAAWGKGEGRPLRERLGPLHLRTTGDVAPAR